MRSFQNKRIAQNQQKWYTEAIVGAFLHLHSEPELRG